MLYAVCPTLQRAIKLHQFSFTITRFCQIKDVVCEAVRPTNHFRTEKGAKANYK